MYIYRKDLFIHKYIHVYINVCTCIRINKSFLYYRACLIIVPEEQGGQKSAIVRFEKYRLVRDHVRAI